MAVQLSGGGGGRYSVKANSEINVTPFVDVMLVLLIIFMVAAPLASVSIKVALPTAVAKPSPTPPKPVYLTIRKDGSIFIGDFSTSLETLPDDLKKAVGTRDPSRERIYIRSRQGHPVRRLPRPDEQTSGQRVLQRGPCGRGQQQVRRGPCP